MAITIVIGRPEDDLHWQPMTSVVGRNGQGNRCRLTSRCLP